MYHPQPQVDDSKNLISSYHSNILNSDSKDQIDKSEIEDDKSYSVRYSQQDIYPEEEEPHMAIDMAYTPVRKIKKNFANLQI